MPDDNHLPPSRRRFLAGAGLVSAGMTSTGLLGACRGRSPEAGRTGDAAEKLFYAGMQWGTATHFNPLGTSAGWPTTQDNCHYVYEALLRFNLVDGSLEPGLATGVANPDQNKIVVPLNDAATWHDGKPVTAEDVVFTFELAKKHSDLEYAAIWDYLSKIEKTGSGQVTFHLNPQQVNPRMVKHYLAVTWVLPQHVWEPLANKGTGLRQHENLNPIGSGPYRLNKHDQTQIELKRHGDYWGIKKYGGLPKPKFLVHPIFKGNQDGDLAFERNEVDVSQQFTPQIWKMWQEKDLPVGTWMTKRPYHIPGSIPMLMFNHTKKGLDNPKVRRALAFAINYEQIANTAMSRYSEPANPSMIIPSGSEEKFFDRKAADRDGWRYDLAEAKRILEDELHAKKGGDGIYVLPDGTRLGPWTAQTPTGWSDWQSALRIVANNANKLGIDIRTKFPQDPVVTQAMNNGNFDIACWSVAGVGAATPWQRFRDAMESRGVPAPGKEAFWNFGRFHSPAAEKLLDKAATTTSDEDAKSAYAELDKIFREHIPMIPLMYRPLQFFEFNKSTWTGFPTERDPYAPPTFQGAGNAWLFKIRKASQG